VTVYSPASEVERIARSLIPFHHSHLAGVRIEYVFREKPAVSGGVTTWGSARKMSGLAALLGTPGALDSSHLDFFVIEIARPVWDEIGSAQRKALVDHELSHCGLKIDDETGNVKLVMLTHDLEEFSGVLRRHGMWKQDIARFLGDVGPAQLAMFSDTLELVDADSFDPSNPAHSGAPSNPVESTPDSTPFPTTPDIQGTT
jgi:predicted metallopeptidase